MQRRLYLEGEIGEKYGHSMVVHAESVRDALRLVEVNNPDFKEYMINCTERGVDFGNDSSEDYLFFRSVLATFVVGFGSNPMLMVFTREERGMWSNR